MSATLVGVNAELKERVNRIFAEDKTNGLKLWLSEGFRTFGEQKVLYAAANVSHPDNVVNHAWAAKPGSSNHERGLAVDIACKPVDNAYREQLCVKYGLHSPLPNEPWHFELAPKRAPLLPLPTLKEASQQMGKNIIACDYTPTKAGYFMFDADGSVYAFGDAQYKGGMNGKKFVGTVTSAVVFSTQGYMLIGSDGGNFPFGDAPNFGNAT